MIFFFLLLFTFRIDMLFYRPRSWNRRRTQSASSAVTFIQLCDICRAKLIYRFRSSNPFHSLKQLPPRVQKRESRRRRRCDSEIAILHLFQKILISVDYVGSEQCNNYSNNNNTIIMISSQN